MLQGKLTYLTALAVGWSVVAISMSSVAQAKDTECPEMDDIDPGNHGTIDLPAVKKAGTALIHENNPEFLKVVEERFKAADADNDGTVDCSELTTPAGYSLLRLTTRGGTVRSHVHQSEVPSSK